jgi:hypothetical protein
VPEGEEGEERVSITLVVLKVAQQMASFFRIAVGRSNRSRWCFQFFRPYQTSTFARGS